MSNKSRLVLDNDKIEIYEGGENVFEDLGFKNSHELSLRADLAVQIIRAIRARKLTQKEAAKIAGVKSPDISNIVNARLNGISAERLFMILNKLGHNIEIRVSIEETPHARTLVLA